MQQPVRVGVVTGEKRTSEEEDIVIDKDAYRLICGGCEVVPQEDLDSRRLRWCRKCEALTWQDVRPPQKGDDRG